MMSWFECVPNISVGKDPNLLKVIGNFLEDVDDLYFLHMDSSQSAGRSVLTMVGTESSLLEAIVGLTELLKNRIDMRNHKGIHPRIGALDVVPVIALHKEDEEMAIKLAGKIGKVLHVQCGLPIYYYEHNATSTLRKDLGQIRRGGYEGLRKRWSISPEWRPDLMPETYDPIMGATVVGARNFLIAFNINISTHRVEDAKMIAAQIRTRGRPGRTYALPAVKAIGWQQADYGLCQVSTNLTDYHSTSPHDIIEVVGDICKTMKLEILGCELVGLVPMEALIGFRYAELNPEQIVDAIEAAHISLGLSSVKPFTPDQHILEWCLARKSRGRLYPKFLSVKKK